MNYDKRHGGPYDRGSADSWYGREPNPHYFLGDTYASERVIVAEGSAAYAAYMAGYAQTPFGQKEW